MPSESERRPQLLQPAAGVHSLCSSPQASQLRLAPGRHAKHCHAKALYLRVHKAVAFWRQAMLSVVTAQAGSAADSLGILTAGLCVRESWCALQCLILHRLLAAHTPDTGH